MAKTDLEKLAEWRTFGARHSEQTVELATRVLASGTLGDQGAYAYAVLDIPINGVLNMYPVEWAVREQLAIAALDLGRINSAVTQIDILHKQFGGSPRVRVLDGLRFEADGDATRAKAVYERLLKDDETDVTAHQRLISLAAPSSAAIPLLLSYLDTFYADPMAWSLLAELYCEQGLYPQALSALGHMSIINNWDDGILRRSGEVAYTLGDYQLSLKHFLRAAEMQGGKASNLNTSRTRTWWGIKLARRPFFI
ncbi:hypothetical protein L198_03325 [Cryptococcus wingfieldii CBS 7118]|uniref:ER membrane protein complex subunit 2 n=1 Tax=Cryptococcus wingfieldii CBS 7118 TaxID=1295528 RepID=A0A1E3JHT6_9TREE|nr:hypothetical protein L198_03325 [Cryptococcus wingfieldii CBS 7118]ODN99481.1 hypothetical protein L198_03325 [Cryptococcus wingfieldii CBS 7118]